MIVLKTGRELSIMKEACRISAGALKIAGEAVEPGVTTQEIDRLAEKYILSQGAVPNFKHYESYPATACISVNNEVIHGIPSAKRKLVSGDIVSIDLIVIINLIELNSFILSGISSKSWSTAHGNTTATLKDDAGFVEGLSSLANRLLATKK